MDFPSKNDIEDAVQIPELVKDPFFRGSEVFKYPSGRLASFGGGFSQVFKMNKEGDPWAFKVWTSEIVDNESRYNIIRKYLSDTALPYFLNFEFVPEGLLVDGIMLSTLRMPWVIGLQLVNYIDFHIENSELLTDLARKFLKMTSDLHLHRISHGDLHHENIFVTDSHDLCLIDYDGICVPELEGTPDITKGRHGYQHPIRFMYGYLASTKVDYFSELIIYLSILSVAENPILWQKYDVLKADYRLLFSTNDLHDFKYSEIRQDLMLLSPTIQSLVLKMDQYLAAHLFLPPLGS